MERRDLLLQRLDRVGPGLRRRLEEGGRRADLLVRFGGVTLHQLGALRHLVKHGPLTMNELAARMEISPSAATQLVERLVQHGLVERAGDPSDRRILRIAVSDSAAAAVRGFEEDRSRRLGGLLVSLSDDELELLASLAERIVGVTPAGPGRPTDDAHGDCL